MKHAFKSFLLENENPVQICGDESLYALQNTSNSTVTLQGSNNAITWVNVIDIPAGTTKHVQSAFAFLKANGKLHVNRTHGSLFTPSLVDKDGNAISNNNPIPVTTYPNAKTSAIEASTIGKLYKAWVTAPATTAKYSAVQIWNPVDSGVTLVVAAANGYNSAGTMKWYSLLNQTKLSETAGFIISLKAGGGAPNFQILTEALTARTVNDSLGSSVSSVAPNGAVLLIGNEFYTIPPGWGLRYEGETVNVGMNLITMIVESENT